ncbi:MAG: hypothetical protein HRT88_19450 [Lentisphaeraceae bacterium]|nr:hypothetical protein [Lentisphaeraceae bacterium]
MFGSLTIMIVLAIGMFYGQAQYKNKRAEWGKTLTILCGIFIIITAMWQNICNIDGGIADVQERERAYMRSQCQYLAGYLKDNYSGNGKCLIILPPKDTSSLSNPDIDHKIAAFKEGFNGKILDIKTVPVKEGNMNPENPADEGPMDMFEATAEDFNKVIEDHQGYDLIIIIASLPYGEEIYDINLFKEKEDDDQEDNSITVGILSGNISKTTEILLGEKAITAMTCWSDKPIIDEEDAPDSYTEAFNKRYLLITPKNMVSQKKKHPKIFPRVKK